MHVLCMRICLISWISLKHIECFLKELYSSLLCNLLGNLVNYTEMRDLIHKLCLGLGCVWTDWHQQEHQAVVVIGFWSPVNHTGSPQDSQTQVIIKYTFLNSSLCQDNTKATIRCYALHCELSSDMISSIHPPETEINSPKMACACPCVGGNEEGDTSNPLTLGNALVNAQLHILTDPPECSAGGHYNINYSCKQKMISLFHFSVEVLNCTGAGLKN